MVEFEFNKKYRSGGDKGSRVAILVGPSPNVEKYVVLKVIEGGEAGESFVETFNWCNGSGWTEIKEPVTVTKYAYVFKDKACIVVGSGLYVTEKAAQENFDRYYGISDNYNLLAILPVTYTEDN